jgi:hypothetical protein
MIVLVPAVTVGRWPRQYIEPWGKPYPGILAGTAVLRGFLLSADGRRIADLRRLHHPLIDLAAGSLAPMGLPEAHDGRRALGVDTRAAPGDDSRY